jgi:Putative prokaryotic signal transducing protein
MSEDLEAIRRELEERPTEELASILRNRDEDEWRPEVFDIVAGILTSRGLSPAEITAQGPDAIDVVEGQSLVTVGRYFSPVQAHAYRMALEAAGLKSWITDEGGGGLYGVGIGARLQVRAEDEKAAREVLESDPVPASEMPAELAEQPCPRCGSQEVTQTAEVVDTPGLHLERPSRAWRYQCGQCGHTWSD